MSLNSVLCLFIICYMYIRKKKLFSKVCNRPKSYISHSSSSRLNSHLIIKKKVGQTIRIL